MNLFKRAAVKAQGRKEMKAAKNQLTSATQELQRLQQMQLDLLKK